MYNLDACINAAYQGSPFLHRLERPMEVRKTKISPLDSLTPNEEEGDFEGPAVDQGSKGEQRPNGEKEKQGSEDDHLGGLNRAPEEALRRRRK